MTFLILAIGITVVILLGAKIGSIQDKKDRTQVHRAA